MKRFGKPRSGDHLSVKRVACSNMPHADQMCSNFCSYAGVRPMCTNGSDDDHSRQWLPRMGLSRTGHTGQSIWTTSIRLIHSAKGSASEALPGGG